VSVKAEKWTSLKCYAGYDLRADFNLDRKVNVPDLNILKTNYGKEYLLYLLQIVHVFRESVALKPPETSFRQGWKEVLSGETLKISDLWEGIAAS
jgi:hypothetical protein